MKHDVVMLILSIIFIVVLFGTAASIAVHANGMKKVYWLICSFLLGLGSLSFIYFLAFPEQQRLPDGSLTGEMPSQLGLAGSITQLGVFGTILGFMVIGLWRLIGLITKRHNS